MDRRQLVSAASIAAVLLVPRGALGQATRSSVPEYVAASIALRRCLNWAQQEVERLLDAQDRQNEEWRIDVLAPFAVVDAVREAALAVSPRRAVARDTGVVARRLISR